MFLALRMKRLVFSILVGCISALSKADSTVDTPPKATLTNVVFTGNGCPSGKATYTLSPDTTRLVTYFDDFTAYIGPGTKPADHRKNCVLTMDISVPPEWAVRVNDKGTDITGYLDLPDNTVTATFKVGYDAGSTGSEIVCT